MGRFEYGLLVIFVSICVYVTTTRAGASKDMPQPPVNMRNIVAGSLIIPMDNKQLISNNFNIKTYGLAVHLLYNEIPLYWAIRSGKLKDAADFQAQTFQVYPTTGTTGNNQFYAGPFIILKAYQTKALNVIRAWQSGSHGVVVHQLAADTKIDIRHEIFVKPKILISNLSGYSGTQTNILNAAGLVKNTHYIITDTGGAISALNAESCYTFFSEPHYLWDKSAPGYYSALLSFVQSGGNFLAECAGAWSYENWNPGSGRGGFQSLAGLYHQATGNKQLLYPNPDVPYNQFYGTLDGVNSGHTPDYCFYPPTNIGTRQVTAGGAEEMSWLTNNAFYAVINDPAVAKCTNGQTSVIASVSKPGQGQGLGGLVFYLGAHDWSGTNTNGNRDAGRRLYLNALITPAARNPSCGFNFCPPGQECPSDKCHTCVCNDAGEAVLTKIPNCCIQESECGSCQSCVNNQCTNDCGDCADCINDQCVTKPCPCTVDDDCIPCYGCDGSACQLLSVGCCTDNSDCGACGYCDFTHPFSPSRSDKTFYICQAIPNCCESDSDCGTNTCKTCNTDTNRCEPDCTPCQTCDSDVCNDVEDCCLVDSNCGDCEVCDLAAATCIECPACTTCNAEKDCVPVADCCVLDDQCGPCSKCTDNACVSTVTGELGSCCVGDDDCTAEGTVCASFSVCAVSCEKDSECDDCEACIDGVCQPTSACEDRDGDKKSDGARFSTLADLL